MLSAKYIDFISNTHLGNLIRESHEAYRFLTQSDDEISQRQRPSPRQRQARKDQQAPVSKQQGHAADDSLDLVPARFTAVNKSLHADLHDAPIRRLSEPYPINSCSQNGQLESLSQMIYEC